jgi:hypothetical protein
LTRAVDAHLASQDDHLARQDAQLQTTAQEVAAVHASASRGFAGAMHLLSNLINRLEGRS